MLIHSHWIYDEQNRLSSLKEADLKHKAPHSLPGLRNRHAAALSLGAILNRQNANKIKHKNANKQTNKQSGTKHVMKRTPVYNRSWIKKSECRLFYLGWGKYASDDSNSGSSVNDREGTTSIDFGVTNIGEHANLKTWTVNNEDRLYLCVNHCT